MADLVVLTSASGKQCSKIIPRLISNPAYTLRLVASRPESIDVLKQQYPKAEVVQADLAQPNDVTRIVSDANVVLHIGPSFHPQETEIGKYMIDACARLPNLKHFVYSSVLYTQLRKMHHHDVKRYVEEHLIESKLPWSILNPTRFFHPLPVGLFLEQHRKAEPVVFDAPWNPDTPMSHIALDDLADAFVKVIEEREKHFYAQYLLCSDFPISYSSIMADIGNQLGISIGVRKLSMEDAEERMMANLFGDARRAPMESREQFARMRLHYETRGLQGNPNVLEWLIGRKPTSNAQWLRTEIQSAQMHNGS